MSLRDILGQNPFTSEVVDQWRNVLNDFNQGRSSLESLNFTLDGDLNGLRGIAREKLHTELIPKPFMGNPNAPVWYLPINPSYSPIDRYDDLGITPICIKKRNQQLDVTEWLDMGKNDKNAACARRQDILLNQLRLDNNSSFVFLKDEFNTLGDCPNCSDNGGYRWWRKRLFGAGNTRTDYLLKTANVSMDAQSVGSKLFVLESFPYHSKEFNVRYYTSTQYFDFWKELVRWGIDNGKKFIVRARNDKFQKLIRAANLNFNDMNRVSLASQNACITSGNLIGTEETMNSIRNLLRG